MNPSSSIPEGIETITAEGKDLSLAIAAAAETIGVDAERVEFKFDMAHFRSSTGASRAQKTVKILAWNTTKSDEEIEKAKAKSKPKREAREDRAPREAREDREPREERQPRERRRRDDDEGGERRGRRGRGRGRDRGDRDEERAPRAKAAPDESLEETEASKFASTWFTTLLEMMSIEGTVKSGGNEERVQLWISAEKAGRLIGKRGSTLGSIRHLLGIAVVKKFGDLIIDVDVEDNRPRNEDRDRKPKRERGDRGDRRGGDRKKGGGDNRSRYPEAKLRALARRAADKAAETKKTITINLELNSYDRRIVHVEVAEIEGVNSRSEERDDGVKIIQVYPAEGEE